MNSDLCYEADDAAVRTRTGVVIPACLPAGVDVARGEALVRDTLTAYRGLVDDPARICVSVDGAASLSDAMLRFCREAGVGLSLHPENRGKLHGARLGVQFLVQRTDLDYVAIVDQDGDHFPNELPNLVRAALHIVRQTGTDRVLVIGRRANLHRPMGFLRGELEELADRVLLDALGYHAAKTGRPLRLEYAAMIEEYPDFHSGFKLFTAASARDVFLQPPELAGVSEACYYRHAVEAVMTVEAMVRGAHLGAVRRSTFNQQPVSTFGLLDRGRLVADMIVWPCRRLGVPAEFAGQWLANHAPRLLLNTLVPQGAAEIERIARLVMSDLTGTTAEESVLRGQPLFL